MNFNEAHAVITSRKCYCKKCFWELEQVCMDEIARLKLRSPIPSEVNIADSFHKLTGLRNSLLGKIYRDSDKLFREGKFSEFDDILKSLIPSMRELAEFTAVGLSFVVHIHNVRQNEADWEDKLPHGREFCVEFKKEIEENFNPMRSNSLLLGFDLCV